MKESGRLAQIAVVKQALTEECLGLQRKDFSSLVMGAGAEFGELIVRQDLLIRIAGNRLNHAILIASGKDHGRVLLPAPAAWRKILTEQGINVAHKRSALLWQLYVTVILFQGAVSIGKIVYAGIGFGRKAEIKKKRYAYFSDLGPGNLPRHGNGNQSRDIISWYLQWPGRKPDIELIRHNVTNTLPCSAGDIAIKACAEPLSGLAGWHAVISFMLWGFAASLLAAFDCLRGRWWHAMLLHPAALAAKARILPLECLAQEYLFHNSNWILRPLWTYEAERRGSSILFYFYSTNCEGFKREDGYPPVPYGWKAMSWSHYLVWDEYQADFVRRAVGDKAHISVVGQIWFQSSSADMPGVEQKGVAVFDVTPFRSSQYCAFGLDFEFYVPAVANRFIEDISIATKEAGAIMLWKRKRNIGRFAHNEYRHCIRKVDESDHVLLIDPDISANRVIESSVAVISMPYTSTALIAKEMGKPSIYYDPCGLLQRDDRAAHGVPILSGVEELNAWILDQIIPDQRSQ